MSCYIFKLVLLCLDLLPKGDCILTYTYLVSLLLLVTFVLCLLTWAAQYNSWLLIEVRPKHDTEKCSLQFSISACYNGCDSHCH